MSDFIAPVNPFPGIRSYEAHEDYLFFGREKQIKELTDLLMQSRFTAIIGSSGCGKSSLIKAGLIPSLLKKKLVQFEGEWKLATFRPGDDPIARLAASIFPSLRDSQPGLTVQKLAEQMLQQGNKGLSEYIPSLLTGNTRQILLYIDQFEELFRFKKNRSDRDSSAEAATFVSMVLDAIHQADSPIYIVLSMRTDFLDECTEYRGLTEAINDGYYLVPRMNRDEIRQVITGPVGVLQGNIDEKLVNRLLDEVGTDPDQLPILQHAMMRTWDHWKIHRIGEEPIGEKHYDEVGTMTEALSIHAEEIYLELSGARAKMLSEKVFKALVDFGEENKGTRRPTAMQLICAQSEAKMEELIPVIDRFREPGRAFLMPPYHIPLEEDTIVDISHESIMRVWTRLRQWSEEELQSSQLYLRLSRSAKLYQEGKTGLWVNPELQLALRWYEQNKPNAAWAVRYDPGYERAIEYLQYSRNAYEQEIAHKENQQKRNLKRTRMFSVVLGTASVISILLLVLALNLMFKSTANEKKALEKEKIALTESRSAAEQTQQAVIQKKISEQQQQIAEQQKIITEEQKDYAIEQQKIAESQKKEAIRQKQLADQSKQQAIRSRDEAETQRKEAVNQKNIADQERVKAANSEQNARRLRMIAIGKAIAIQGARMPAGTEGDLPSLLALQAYSFIDENKGNIFDPDLYKALSNVADDKPVLRGHKDEVRGIALSSSGLLLSCGTDGSVRLWNSSNPGEPSKMLNTARAGKNGFRCIALSDDNKRAACGSTNGDILVWNSLNPNEIPFVLNVSQKPISSVCFLSPTLVAFVSSDGILGSLELSGNKLLLGKIISLGKKVHQMALAPDKQTLLLGTEKGEVLSVKTGGGNWEAKLVRQFQKPVTSLAVSPDGLSVAAGLSSGLIKVFSLADPLEEVIDLIGHSSGINTLAFSHDGKLLASGCYDRTVRLWNYQEAGTPPVIIDDSDKWVYGLCFSADNKKLVFCSADKTIRQSTIDPVFLAGKICNQMKRNLSKEEWNKYIGGDIPYRKTCSSNP